MKGFLYSLGLGLLVAAFLFVEMSAHAQSLAPAPGMDLSSGLAVDGGISTSALTVYGSTTFYTRPTGVVLSGSAKKDNASTVGVGCLALASLTVLGAAIGDACFVSALPAGAYSLSMLFDCQVTGPSAVSVRACGLVSLVSAPAGLYSVRVIGP